MCSCRPRYGRPAVLRNARKTELRRPPTGGSTSSPRATRREEEAATVGRVDARRPRSLLLDAAVAALALAMSLGPMAHGGWNRNGTGANDHRLDALGVALALAMALPLVA